MSTNRKGFFTIDAFFAFLLLVSISGMLLGLAQSHEQVARSSSAILQADMVAEKLAAVINSVYANGSNSPDVNFELRINLPENIIGDNNYSISFDSEKRVISVEDLDGVSSGVATASIISGNVYDFELGPENLKRTIKVYWSENIIKVKNNG